MAWEFFGQQLCWEKVDCEKPQPTPTFGPALRSCEGFGARTLREEIPSRRSAAWMTSAHWPVSNSSFFRPLDIFPGASVPDGLIPAGTAFSRSHEFPKSAVLVRRQRSIRSPAGPPSQKSSE